MTGFVSPSPKKATASGSAGPNSSKEAPTFWQTLTSAEASFEALFLLMPSAPIILGTLVNLGTYGMFVRQIITEWAPGLDMFRPKWEPLGGFFNGMYIHFNILLGPLYFYTTVWGQGFILKYLFHNLWPFLLATVRAYVLPFGSSLRNIEDFRDEYSKMGMWLLSNLPLLAIAVTISSLDFITTRMQFMSGKNIASVDGTIKFALNVLAGVTVFLGELLYLANSDLHSEDRASGKKLKALVR